MAVRPKTEHHMKLPSQCIVSVKCGSYPSSSLRVLLRLDSFASPISVSLETVFFYFPLAPSLPPPSLASRSVSTGDAVPTSTLRPCGVVLVSRSLLAKTCFSKLATAHWTATTQGRPRQTYACGAEARIHGRMLASTNCFRATTYVHKVDLLRNLRMLKSQLVHVHSCVRHELIQVQAIVRMFDDDDNAAQSSAFHNCAKYI